MSSLLDDAALIQDTDQIGILHRGDAMRNNQAGTVAHNPTKPREDLLLRVRVDRGQGIVEKENPGFSQNRSSDRRSLLLTAGESNAPLADENIISLRKAGYIFRQACDLRCPLDLCRLTFVHSKSNISLQRIAEQERFLRDITNAGSKLRERVILNGHSVD